MSRAVRRKKELAGTLWSAGFLAFVLPLTAEQVLVAATPFGGVTPESRAEWTWIQTAQRLTWLYGEAGALHRLNNPHNALPLGRS